MLKKELLNNLEKVFGSSDNSENMAFGITPLFSEDNISNTYYIEENGEIVSQASLYKFECNLNGSVIKVISLGAVCTLQKYRHKGYATRIIKKIIEDKKREKNHLMIVSGDIELYTKLGCVKTGKVLIGNFNDKFYNANGYTIKKTTRKDRLKNYFKYHLLYAEEKYRYIREPRFTRQAMDFEGIEKRVFSVDLYEIKNQKDLIAYVIVYKSIKKHIARILEYAGSRLAIFESMCFICHDLDVEVLKIGVHPKDYEMINLCAMNGIKLKGTFSQGTVTVLDARALFSAIKSKLKKGMGSQLKLKKLG